MHKMHRLIFLIYRQNFIYLSPNLIELGRYAIRLGRLSFNWSELLLNEANRLNWLSHYSNKSLRTKRAQHSRMRINNPAHCFASNNSTCFSLLCLPLSGFITFAVF
jgi:hypothetical protein